MNQDLSTLIAKANAWDHLKAAVALLLNQDLTIEPATINYLIHHFEPKSESLTSPHKEAEP